MTIEDHVSADIRLKSMTEAEILAEFEDLVNATPTPCVTCEGQGRNGGCVACGFAWPGRHVISPEPYHYETIPVRVEPPSMFYAPVGSFVGKRGTLPPTMSQNQDDIATLTDGTLNAADIAAVRRIAKRIAKQGNVKLWIALAVTALISVAPMVLPLLTDEPDQPTTEAKADTDDGKPEHTKETDAGEDRKLDLGS